MTTSPGDDAALPPDRRRRRALGARLWRLADVLQASERRRSFRARAFRTAVWALDSLSSRMEESPEETAQVEGIGPGIIRLIEEFRATGDLAELRRLDGLFPVEVATLARLPRTTPDRLRALKALGVDTPADLLAAIEAGALTTIEGVGPATLDRWAAILALPPSPGWAPSHRAWVAANRLRQHLTAHLEGDRVTVAGSVRRLDEWVGRIDLVVVTEDPQRLVQFCEESAAFATSAVEPGWAVDAVTHDRLPVALRLSDPPAAGTALVRWTGPEDHAASLGLDEEAAHRTEQEAYAAAGQVWLPPPARVRHDHPPDLVALEHVRGDLHVHSEASPDGHMSLAGIAEEAQARGYGYVAITDHTIGLRFGGLDSAALRHQRKLVEELRLQYPDLVILHGAEVNVDRDGVPDLDDETLEWLDLVVAGCHSHFDLPRPDQTARLLTAVHNRNVDVLAHPCGRRIGIRPGFDVDLAAVIEAAAESGTALEVNGHRDRMDLSAANAEVAAARGVYLAADSDAHRYPEFDNIGVAVGIMQRAAVGRNSVVNALDTEDFLGWLAGR